MNQQQFAQIYLEKSIPEVMIHFGIARNTVHYWARKYNLYKINKNLIEQCKEKYPQNDYSSTKYINKNTLIKFICPTHGIVEQNPVQHLKHGCPFCSGRGISKYNLEYFLKRCKEIHGDTYDYSLIKEVNLVNDEVDIICKTHGKFTQKVKNHINSKQGCSKCKGGVKYTHKQFTEKANKKYDGKFEYPEDYNLSHDKIEIICPIHGKFKQLAYMHLQTTYGCGRCAAEQQTSIAEQEIADFVGNCIRNDREILKGKEIDILIPKRNIGIEYHGLYWHVEGRVGQRFHYDKMKEASIQNIRLIQIFEHEWANKKDIIKSRLNGILGKNETIYARETEICSLSLEEKNNFLEMTHLQGKDNSSVYYGLKQENKLVAAMTFGKSRFSRKWDWELIRFSCSLGANVVGGAGKLLSHFRRNNADSIMTFSDNRWGNGNLYKVLEFRLDGETPLGYFYYNLKTKEIKSRMSCQKIDKNGQSELDFMRENGYDKVWDAGNLRWVLQ